MNTGYPAVSGEGAIGAVEPFEITDGDVKRGNGIAPPAEHTIPANWPAHRVPTEDEWHRRMREARWPRAEVYR